MHDKIEKTVVVEVTEDKPYNKCIKCRHLGVRCDGPNFAAMSMERIVEWIRIRKEYLGWSNAHLAEESNTPKGTVDRVLAGGHTDFKMGTIAPILKALVGGSWGKFPCPDMDNIPPDIKTLLEMFKAREAEAASLRAQITKLESDHKEIEKAEEAKHQRTIDYLKTDVSELKAKLKESQRENTLRRRGMALLAVSTIALLVLVIVALLIDRANPNIGFLWMSQL